MERQSAERIVELNQQINKLTFRIITLLTEIGKLRKEKKFCQEEIRMLRRREYD